MPARRTDGDRAAECQGDGAGPSVGHECRSVHHHRLSFHRADRCAAALCAPFAAEVAVVARHDAQKVAAEKLGAGLEPAGEYDIVIECAGNNDALAQAARLCRPRGKLLLLATYWEGVQLPAFEVSMKNLTIEASSMYSQSGLSRDVDVAAQLLGQYPRIAEALISHRMPLDAAVEAFEVARDRRGGAIKVVLEP